MLIAQGLQGVLYFNCSEHYPFTIQSHWFCVTHRLGAHFSLFSPEEEIARSRTLMRPISRYQDLTVTFRRHFVCFPREDSVRKKQSAYWVFFFFLKYQCYIDLARAWVRVVYVCLLYSSRGTQHWQNRLWIHSSTTLQFQGHRKTWSLCSCGFCSRAEKKLQRKCIL